MDEEGKKKVEDNPENQDESLESEELEEQATATEEAESTEDEDEELEKKEKLAFPVAAVVRLMKRNLDKEKILKKEVKIAMNKWLEHVCRKVSREMNKFPYVTMSINEFKEGTRVYDSLENFDKDKQRILAHMDAIKKDIERLERDLGKVKDEDGEL